MLNYRFGQEHTCLAKVWLGHVWFHERKGASGNGSEKNILGDGSKQFLSVEENEYEKSFVELVFRNNVGRYGVDLPVIQIKLRLFGDLHDYAYRWFLSLETRFAKNPKLFFDYKSFIGEYLRLGHAKVVDLVSESEDIRHTFSSCHIML